MAGGRPWTETEKRIVRDTYPLHGPGPTTQALRDAGYPRTQGAVEYRAHILNVQRKRNPWNEYEDAILHRWYPSTGVTGTQAALAAKGYHRTGDAICTRAYLLGVHLRPATIWTPPRPPKPRRQAKPKPTPRPRVVRVNGRKLTRKQTAVLKNMPTADLLDADNPPTELERIAIRQVARTLAHLRLVKHEGFGLYRLTLRGLTVQRELVRGDDA